MERCIVLLSTKSAGSSVLQDLIVAAGGRHIGWTEHVEHETLFWVKAASLLGRPQEPMHGGIVPYPEVRARRSLTRMLEHNGVEVTVPEPATEQALVAAWVALRAAHGPCFVEKSPHHLRQWSALELLAGAIRADTAAEYLVVGLVRNPHDVAYSAWRRWRHRPSTFQHEWLASYRNLERARSLFGDRLRIVRYEDMVVDPGAVGEVVRFAGGSHGASLASGLHARSVGGALTDVGYGFELAEEVRAEARRWGYGEEVLVNPNRTRTWAAREAASAGVRGARREARHLLARARNR